MCIRDSHDAGAHKADDDVLIHLDAGEAGGGGIGAGDVEFPAHARTLEQEHCQKRKEQCDDDLRGNDAEDSAGADEANGRMNAGDDAAVHISVGHTCLLYTSRCV